MTELTEIIPSLEKVTDGLCVALGEPNTSEVGKDFFKPDGLSKEECIKVEQERTLFVEDDVYKSIETFKEQIPNLPEYVYWILFLRYNRQLLNEYELRHAEETISRLRNNMKQEQAYYQKLFEDNSGNVIDCSPIQNENELTNIGFN
jgi:hypothetical protein